MCNNTLNCWRTLNMHENNTKMLENTLKLCSKYVDMSKMHQTHQNVKQKCYKVEQNSKHTETSQTNSAKMLEKIHE